MSVAELPQEVDSPQGDVADVAELQGGQGMIDTTATDDPEAAARQLAIDRANHKTPKLDWAQCMNILAPAGHDTEWLERKADTIRRRHEAVAEIAQRRKRLADELPALQAEEAAALSEATRLRREYEQESAAADDRHRRAMLAVVRLRQDCGTGDANRVLHATHDPSIERETGDLQRAIRPLEAGVNAPHGQPIDEEENEAGAMVPVFRIDKLRKAVKQARKALGERGLSSEESDRRRRILEAAEAAVAAEEAVIAERQGEYPKRIAALRREISALEAARHDPERIDWK